MQIYVLKAKKITEAKHIRLTAIISSPSPGENLLVLSNSGRPPNILLVSSL